MTKTDVQPDTAPTTLRTLAQSPNLTPQQAEQLLQAATQHEQLLEREGRLRQKAYEALQESFSATDVRLLAVMADGSDSDAMRHVQARCDRMELAQKGLADLLQAAPDA